MAIDSQESMGCVVSVSPRYMAKLSRVFARWKHERSIGRRGESIICTAPCGVPGEVWDCVSFLHLSAVFSLCSWCWQCSINWAHKICIRALSQASYVNVPLLMNMDALLINGASVSLHTLYTSVGLWRLPRRQCKSTLWLSKVHHRLCSKHSVVCT